MTCKTIVNNCIYFNRYCFYNLAPLPRRISCSIQKSKNELYEIEIPLRHAIPYSVDNGKLATGLATCATEADYLINMALLKGHVGQGVTLCAKNYYGVTSIDNNWRKNARNNFNPDRKGIPQYLTFSDMYLIEAALEENPPSKAKYDPQRNNAKIHSLGVMEHWNNAIMTQSVP